MRKRIKKALLKDDKDKYRKKPYTPPSATIQENEFTKILLVHIVSLLKGDLNSRRKELYELLRKIGQKGACLDIVAATLHPLDIMPLLLDKKGEWLSGEIIERMKEKGIKESDLMYIYDSQDKDVIEEYGKNFIAWGKKIRSLKGAVSQILNLKPLQTGYFPQAIIDELNKELQDVQRRIESMVERYINIKEWSQFPPHLASQDNRPKNQTSQKRKQKELLQISEKVKALFDDLIRIGYSNNTADTIIGKLLNLSYHPYYKDNDPNLIRQKRTYHSRKSK